MSCRFPGAEDPDALWKMVAERRESVAEYPGGRTPELDAFYRRAGRPDGPGLNGRGGFLPDIDKFDAGFFEVSPREAEWLDPQQRLLLEASWEALEDAGISLRVLSREKTGVFVGVWLSEYEHHAKANAPVSEFFLITGGPLFGISSRISFQFDLRGPDVSVNAACGSSLVAVHLATQSLRSGECSVALAGGVNVQVRHECTQAFSRAKMLSPDGRCKFGADGADGFVRSDGRGHAGAQASCGCRARWRQHSCAGFEALEWRTMAAAVVCSQRRAPAARERQCLRRSRIQVSIRRQWIMWKLTGRGRGRGLPDLLYQRHC